MNSFKVIGLSMLVIVPVYAQVGVVNPYETTLFLFAKKLEPTSEEILFKKHAAQKEPGSFYKKFKEHRSTRALSFLQELLKSEDTPENRAIALYVLWNYISAWAFTEGIQHETPEFFNELRTLFEQSYKNSTDTEPIAMLSHILSTTVNSLQSKQKTDTEAYRTLQDMLEKLRNAYPDSAK